MKIITWILTVLIGIALALDENELTSDDIAANEYYDFYFSGKIDSDIRLSENENILLLQSSLNF